MEKESKDKSLTNQQFQPEGVTWPDGWRILLGNNKTTYYGECPICGIHFQDRVVAQTHDREPHRPEIILDDGCCSCWTHC